MSDWPWWRVAFGIFKWFAIAVCVGFWSEAYKEAARMEVKRSEAEAKGVFGKSMYDFRRDSLRDLRQETYYEKRRKEFEGARAKKREANKPKKEGG